MANALALYYIIFSWLAVIVNIVLTVALLSNFIKKKTTGTLILFASYFIIGLSAIIGALDYTGEFYNVSIKLIGTSQSIATLAPLIALLLIYIFTCRHILRDNEVVKSLHLITFSLMIGAIFMVYILAVFQITPQQPDFLFAEGESPLWYQLSRTNISNTGLYNLSIVSTAFFITAIQIYINVRIIVRSFILSRRTDKIIRKRGLQMIGWGLIVYLLAGIIISLELAVPWSEGSIAPTIFWTLRKIVFLVAYLILYLGWIMPDWFRRRLRGKTWFEKQYKTVSKQS
ncbi:MAG: hypothetical protein ACTSQK_08650 [Candidatus Heimdallarchaeota archaeon]